MTYPYTAWMPMNLQLFAEADPPAEEGRSTEEKGGDKGAAGAPAALTMEEVMRMIQSESDKRVTQALAKQKKEFDRKMSLSGLDEQERKNLEKDQHIEELTEKLRAATSAKNHLELVRTLTGRGMPAEFADLIEIGEDSEEAIKKINALETAFRKAVEDEVNKRIAGKGAPGRSGARASMSIEEIMKIVDSSERQKAIEQNIDLFRKG